MSALAREAADADFGEDAPLLGAEDRADAAVSSPDEDAALEARRARERREGDFRAAVRTLVRVINIALLLDILLALMTTYLRASGAVRLSWFVAGAPWFVVAALWTARSAAKWAALPAQDVLEISSRQYGVRPRESHARSILLTCAATVSLGLGLAVLDRRVALGARLVLAPLEICLLGLVASAAYDVWVRPRRAGGADAGVTVRRQAQEDSAMRLALIVYALSLATVVLAGLRIDKVLDVSWFLVLAWPVVVLSFWAVAAIGLSCLMAGWLATACRGRGEELDGLFREMIGHGAYHGSSGQRYGLLVGAVVCVVALDLVVIGAFVSIFYTIKILNAGQTAGVRLEPVFIPLIFDALVMVIVAVLLDFALLPYLRYVARAGSASAAAAASSSARSTPLKLNTCITCRSPVDQIVSLHDPNVRVQSVDDSLENADCAVCMIRPSDTIFLPCGHSGICQPCAQHWILGDKADLSINEALAHFSPVQTPLTLLRKSHTFFTRADSDSDIDGGDGGDAGCSARVQDGLGDHRGGVLPQ